MHLKHYTQRSTATAHKEWRNKTILDSSSWMNIMIMLVINSGKKMLLVSDVVFGFDRNKQCVVSIFREGAKFIGYPNLVLKQGSMDFFWKT